MRLAAAMVFLTGILVSGAQAQFSWAKDVGISGTTTWTAAVMDGKGGLYFGGMSEKLTGTPNRGYVMAKVDDTAKALWNTKLLGSIATFAGLTCVGVDSAGNSYMLDKFSTTPLKLPDSTEISYFLPCYFVAKFAPNGKMAWCKRLVIGGVERFQAMSDGTVGILASNTASIIFGNDTLPSKSSGAGQVFIEIKTDGTMGRYLPASDITEAAITFSQWSEPGKVFAVTAEPKALSTTLYHRGTLDLGAKSFKEDGTPLSVESPPNTFLWVNNGFPNSPTTVLEPKSGHLFVIMSAINGDSKLNGADTIMRQTSTEVRDGYVVELDDQMKVVHKIHLTNPLQVAARDSQIVVTALVRATNGFGFVSPDTTIKITLTRNNQDGYVLYVMDRNFKFKKHGLVEGTLQTTLTPNLTLIAADGGIYHSMQAGGDLTLQGMPIVNRGRYVGTVLMKMPNGLSSGISAPAKSPAGRIRLSPFGNELTIDRPGAFRYLLTNTLGARMTTGEGSGHAVIKMSAIPEGAYFLTLRGNGASQSLLIRKGAF